MARPSTPTPPRDRDIDERRNKPAEVSTKQIAKDAMRGGPKTEKKNKRPGAGGSQKG